LITAELFCAELYERGFSVATGVPCSYFGGPIALLSQIPGRYVAAANEGNALAIAAGASLAGRRAYVMAQNSGLGNLINPLTSLVMTYRIPVLTFVSLRGWPDGTTDGPQHEVMGRITRPLIDLIGLPHWVLQAGDDGGRFREILDSAGSELAAGNAPIVLVEKGAVSPAYCPVDDLDDGLASRNVIQIVAEACADNPIVATTGYTSRELFGMSRHPANFCMQGSMGHASALALGIALSRPERPVVVLDGDGSALMHLGNMSVIGHEAPANLVHIVLDNGIHESTGGQASTSDTTAFDGIALAVGYRTAVRCNTLPGLHATITQALGSPGPHLCVVHTKRRTGYVPPRATNTFPPEAIRDRFSQAVR
jgi:phosphonopyruvate decarboxylase